MAEAILNHFGKGIAVAKSAGLFANKGQEANPKAAKALEKLGIDLNGHTSQPLTKDLVDWAGLILTMTQNHKKSIISDYPEAIDKTYTLKEYVYDQLEQNQFWKSWQEAISEREEAKLIVDQYAKEKTGLDQSKKEAIERLIKADERVKTLEEEFPNYDINDPFGADFDEYQVVSHEIASLIKQWMETKR